MHEQMKKNMVTLDNISIWICYSLVSKDIPRTNNAVRGWYNCFTTILNQYNSSRYVEIHKRIQNRRKYKQSET